MAGIYLHIPFCRQACHYCNFHFSTSLRLKEDFVGAVVAETELRKDYLKGEQIETIYFGGGTASLLDQHELDAILNTIHRFHPVKTRAEITFEANPDDVSRDKLAGWNSAGIN